MAHLLRVRQLRDAHQAAGTLALPATQIRGDEMKNRSHGISCFYFDVHRLSVRRSHPPRIPRTMPKPHATGNEANGLPCAISRHDL